VEQDGEGCIGDLGQREMRIFFPMGLDSPNHTKSGPSGARFFQDVIRHRHGKEKFDTSGKSPASVHHRRDSLVHWTHRNSEEMAGYGFASNPPYKLRAKRVAEPMTRADLGREGAPHIRAFQARPVLRNVFRDTIGAIQGA
jgi:hypothetical protein